jgi:hypothetical protein
MFRPGVSDRLGPRRRDADTELFAAAAVEQAPQAEGAKREEERWNVESEQDHAQHPAPEAPVPDAPRGNLRDCSEQRTEDPDQMSTTLPYGASASDGSHMASATSPAATMR